MAGYIFQVVDDREMLWTDALALAAFDAVGGFPEFLGKILIWTSVFKELKAAKKL